MGYESVEFVEFVELKTYPGVESQTQEYVDRLIGKQSLAGL
jgi:hypothetical protein